MKTKSKIHLLRLKDYVGTYRSEESFSHPTRDYPEVAAALIDPFFVTGFYVSSTHPVNQKIR
jgi:hypothetical protein